MVSNESVSRFLGGRRLAVIGASDDSSNFGGTIYRAFRDHGYTVVAVNPMCDTVAGDRCYHALAAVPGPIDGAVIMVSQAKAADVVRACVERDVPRVWLFKGLGGPGALSDEAVRICDEEGIDVVAGACPLMFLEPVGLFHRFHRGIRRLDGSLTTTANS